MTVVSRVLDRVRPWSAPMPPAGAPRVAVIGAGAAGLATAALLRQNGTDATVFDRRAMVGGGWPDRYDSVRLNTVRWMSDLPGYRMPRRYGRWVGRDDLVEYLADYADHHSLPLRLNSAVSRIDEVGSGWQITIDNSIQAFDGIVVATGHSQRPTTPPWPGIEDFAGHFMHAAEYRSPTKFAGKRVVVVGAGSTGGELCVELAASGVDVVWAVRTAPFVFPREVGRLPATPFAPATDMFPDRWIDRGAPVAERVLNGERDYLPEPSTPMMTALASCKEPMTADGIVDAIRSGKVRVVEAVELLDPDGVVLVDGTHIGVDVVVAATGYHPGLEPLVEHLDVLDRNGRPSSARPRRGLGFVGFRIPLTGTLWAIETDARKMAHNLLV